MDLRENFTQMIEMILVGHGVKMEDLQNTRDLSDEILEMVGNGGNAEAVGLLMRDGLMAYPNVVPTPLSPFMADVIRSAALRVIGE